MVNTVGFFLFIEAILVSYRKYRSAKKKKLLSELKKEGWKWFHCKSSSSSSRRFSPKEESAESRWDTGRLTSFPLTSVQVSPCRRALPEQACWHLSILHRNRPLPTPPLWSAGREATYADGKQVARCMEIKLRPVVSVDLQPRWTPRPLSEVPT